jgi:hypothetical protein
MLSEHGERAEEEDKAEQYNGIFFHGSVLKLLGKS